MWTAEQISDRFLVTGKLEWPLHFLHKLQWDTGVLAAWSRQSCKLFVTGSLYQNNLYT